MGRNLALNMARNGYATSIWDRDAAAVEQQRPHIEGKPVFATTDLGAFVQSLQAPRRIILLIPAGKPIDEMIGKLRPMLADGDMIVDSGNSHPHHTEARSKALEGTGLRFLGMGISGGEEGALNGPSLMPGGPAEAYAELAAVLEAIAANVGDGPCVTHIGPGSAGHFTKTIHNGIEYGDMQLIAEAYDLMTEVCGMKPAAIGEVFAAWNRGPLESYLIEITADILSQTDPATKVPMVDVILDRAGQKGTGRWTAELGLEFGVPMPTIQAAVQARALSANKEQRVHAATLLTGPSKSSEAPADLITAIHDALYASKICSYAQGLDLLQTASREHDWKLDFTEIARIWKGGCIIRARFLDAVKTAYSRDSELPNLLLDETFRAFIEASQDNWRRVVALAAEQGVPALAMAGSLSYYDSYRRAQLPQNLTQAQRDYFGAHTFERLDKPRGEFFHHKWY